MDTKLMVTSSRNVVLAGVYIFGVSQLMNHAEKLFNGPINQALAPFAFLLLFSLSAAVVGSLVFGQPVVLFLENKRVEGIKSTIYSVATLFLITLATIVTLVVVK